jgi:hypothetical protein
MTIQCMEMFTRFRPEIASATAAEISSDPTLGGRLSISGNGSLTMSYAPFDYISAGARVVIVGITPGAQQATNALLSANASLRAGQSDLEALSAAKAFASFSGPMRANLVAMLNHIGLPGRIGVHSCESLWDDDLRLAHFTSALRYPVSLDGKNYAGRPSMTLTSYLRDIMHKYLAVEADSLKHAVWIPLGPMAAEGVREMVGRGRLAASQVLEGLPHPSGANAERIAYFLGRKDRGSLSAKTNPSSLDSIRVRLSMQVAALSIS